MVLALLIILIILWFFGFIPFALFQTPLFTLNGNTITLYELLIFGVVLWLIGLLPSPLREIGAVLLLLWVLSVLGFLAIGGLSQILIIAIILGVIVSLFS